MTGSGKFAILATRFPGDKEADRKVVGLFRIDKVESNNSALSKSGGIRLPLEEAKAVPTKNLIWLISAPTTPA